MKKYLFAYLLLFFFPLFSVFAFSSNPFTFSESFDQNLVPNKVSLYLQPLAGYSFGTFYEYVYFVNSDTGVTFKLSELDWDFTNAFFLGGKIGASWWIFDFSLFGKGYFPARSGIMQDSDWLNLSDTSMKTTYSISENYLTEAFSVGTEIEASVLKNSFFSVNGLFSFEYDYYNFSAGNGIGWYGQIGKSSDGQNHYWYDEEAFFYNVGELSGINYEFSRTLIWFGLDMNISPFKWITFNGGVKTAFLSFFTDIDFHDSNDGGNYFWDSTLSVFSAFNLHYNLLINISENLSFKFGFDDFYSLIQIGLSGGNSYYKNSYAAYNNSYGGNEARCSSLTLSAIVKFK